MSVPNTTQRADYTGSATTGPFTFNFKIFSEDQLYVFKTRTSTGAVTDLTLTTDYTVSGVGEDSGSITLVDELAFGYTLTILRNLDFVQESVFANQRQQNARTWENAFDYGRMLDLQLKRSADAAIKLPDGEDADDFDLKLPDADSRANAFLVFDADGNVSTTPATGTLTGYTAGSVLFANASGFPTQNNSAFSWDDSTNALKVTKLGIGQAVSGASILGVLSSEAIASGASATWDGINVITATATLSGSTNITTAAGFNLFSVNAPSISAASALTITHAAALTVLGAPAGGGAGPATITNSYAFWVQSGAARFGGQILGKPGTTTSPSYSIFGQTGDGMWSRVSAVLNWSVGGTTVLELQSNVLMLNAAGVVGFNESSIGTGNIDAYISRSAAKVLLVGAADGVKVGDDGTNCEVIPSHGQLYFKSGAMATNATVGFMCIPSGAGAPVGTPASIPTGQIPVYYDSSNNFLYVYNSGWKKSSVYA